MTGRAMLYLHAASPLHVGTGQSLDVIDLPIQRERSTDLPVVGGSAVKGVMRAECEGLPDNQSFVDSAFGSEKDASAAAGAVTFGDARLLLFPIRSVQLLFAWVTCPYVLRRYVRDREVAGLDVKEETAAIKAVASAGSIAHCAHHSLLVDTRSEKDSAAGTIFLEDADIQAQVSAEMALLATALAPRCLPEPLQPLLIDRLVVVNDTLFGMFSRQCTEVSARVKLDDDKKTVTTGGLWYEEALPSEAILYSSVLAESTRGSKKFTADAHINGLCKVGSAQFGGKASIGRGLCHLTWEVPA